MAEFEDLLDALAIAPGDTVLLHSSYRRLQYIVTSPEDLIERVTSRLGTDGTLVVPRYAWHLYRDERPWRGYAEFLRTKPTVDLRSTPANIGAIPEVFRKLPGVVCSLSHFWPVAARGRNAAAILNDQDKVTHSYGPGSVFARLVEADVRILGLGVTLNTSSIAPVADLAMDKDHRRYVFTPNPIPGFVIDQNGITHSTAAITMTVEAVRDIKPGRIMAGILTPKVDFPYLVVGDTIYFSYRASLYHRIALAMGRDARARGEPVPWFS
jgi:hypothetical protein